jgi:hypothetical protein
VNILPDVFFIGAQFGGPIKRGHFTTEIHGLSATLHIASNCPAGVIKANCAWYEENNGGVGVSTPNVSISVQP